MDKIKKVIIKSNVILPNILIVLVLLFVIYRVCFYIFLGQPLEMGNIPSTAPYIFRIVKNVLIFSLGFSPLLLLVYLLIVLVNIKNGELGKAGYFYAISVAIAYSVFWFFDFGSVWLFW